MSESEKYKICETLGLIEALISGAGIVIGVFQQINGFSCSEKNNPTLFRGFM